MDEKNLLFSNRENSIAKLTCNADERGQMVRIAVCDDEKYYREKIMKLLKKEFGKRELQDYVIDEYVAGTELLKENHLLVYDIIFLDINIIGCGKVYNQVVLLIVQSDRFAERKSLL